MGFGRGFFRPGRQDCVVSIVNPWEDNCACWANGLWNIWAKKSFKVRKDSFDAFLHIKMLLGGGNSNIFLCSPLVGEDEPILTCAYFSNGLVQPQTRLPLRPVG